MGIKRYFATQDTTITNAFKIDLSTRATASNMGQSDVLEVFSIYGQNFMSASNNAKTYTTELSRAIIEFPISGSSLGNVLGDRDAGKIPDSGSVRFYLRMFNASHGQTIPRDTVFNIHAVSSSWTEGRGLDMDSYLDKDASNWMERSSSAYWETVGGDFHTGTYVAGENLPMYTAGLTNGYDDLEVDVTSMVEEWIAGRAFNARQNYGFAVYLTSSQEAYYSSSLGKGIATGSILDNLDGARESYYTKKFFARGTEYFFRRPALEARWDSSKKDDRESFYFSSSLAPAEDNLNSLYLYNFSRGQLQDIGGNKNKLPVLKLYDGTADAPNGIPEAPASLTLKNETTNANVTSGITATRIEKGIYSASFAITGNSTNTAYLWDVWEVDGVQIHTGTVLIPKDYGFSNYNPHANCVTKITNLKSVYSDEEVARLRLFVRSKDWSPTIYTVANSDIENKIIENAYYKVYRLYDNLDVINYGTSSVTEHTRLSHDVSGNYFDLDMSLLEKDKMYGIKFVFKVNDEYQEQSEVFKFRVAHEV